MSSLPKVRIDSVLRTVPNLSEAERFYRDALDFSPQGNVITEAPEEALLLDVPHHRMEYRRMTLGQQAVDFIAFDPPGRPYPAASTSSDLWFQHCAIVVGDMERAYARVMTAGALPISEGGPQRLPANTGGVTAFKFRDPFGHPLELLAFPKGAGAPVWHHDDGTLFRGLDHTAIAISSSEASRNFYAAALGLEVADRSHNSGPEQTHLDAVPDDAVDVTALMPERAPPHLELLAYRAGSRRSLRERDPADTAISRTIAVSHDLATVTSALSRAGAQSLRHGRWLGRDAVRFRDPDGHEWICRSAARAETST